MTKRCKHCKQEFQPRTSTQTACGPVCAYTLAVTKREKKAAEAMKAERKAIKARKEAIKSRAQWAREAQTAINQWVRQRDALLPCVSCGRHHEGQYHCGHYLSRGAHPELAYEPLNLAKQCAPCNTHLSGNQVNFRRGLIERIGIEKVEWLEGPHEPKKYTILELKEIRNNYRAKLRELRGK